MSVFLVICGVWLLLAVTVLTVAVMSIASSLEVVENYLKGDEPKPDFKYPSPPVKGIPLSGAPMRSVLQQLERKHRA